MAIDGLITGMAHALPPLEINHLAVPRFFYGTAWKEDRTAELTFRALDAGFTAVDTANQRKHYFEEGVGQGIQKFLDLTQRRREELFLQTKFTFARGQDHRKPYDENDSFAKQVADSFSSSLAHLQTSYLDSYVLHGPYHHEGIGDEDLESWAAMEKHHASGKARLLGISNVSASQLESLCDQVKVKPHFVQNRCFARMGWDRDVRAICADRKITYQGFSLLTANRNELQTSPLQQLTRKYSKTVSQIVFRFSQQIGMITLTGTTDEEHMREDLDIYDFDLQSDEIKRIEDISFHTVE